jgi:hypothetical protein
MRTIPTQDNAAEGVVIPDSAFRDWFCFTGGTPTTRGRIVVEESITQPPETTESGGLGTTAPTEPTSPLPIGVSELAFITRARRILGGDVRPEDYLPVTATVRRAVEMAMD